MARLERWGWLCLVGCLLAVTVSLTLPSRGWQVAVASAGVVAGILSGGLLAASVRRGCGPGGEPGAGSEDSG